MLLLDAFQAPNCSISGLNFPTISFRGALPPLSSIKLLWSLPGVACKPKNTQKKVLQVRGKNDFLERGGGNDFKNQIYTPDFLFIPCIISSLAYLYYLISCSPVLSLLLLTCIISSLYSLYYLFSWLVILSLPFFPVLSFLVIASIVSFLYSLFYLFPLFLILSLP